MGRLVFKGGTVIDGSGSPAFESDVVIEGNTIVSITKAAAPGAARVMDISGLVLCPGFVDIHSHSDYYLLIDPLGQSKVRQGVTTEVGGNCGYSAAPVQGFVLEEREKVYKEQFDLTHDWTSLHGYLEKLEKTGISLNYAPLIGANTIRGSVMGYDNREPTGDELSGMCTLIERSMDEGAFGLSFGMVYVPLCYAGKDELVHLAKTVRKSGGIITTHIRSESRGLIEAIEEVISIARESGAPLQISHLKTMGEENWWKIDKLLSLIEEARQEGLAVTCDRYPYLAANTGLQAVLPDHALEGGREKVVRRLKDPAFRIRITEEIKALHPSANYWDSVMISQVVTEKNRDIEGKSVKAAASVRGKETFDFLYDLLIEENTEVDSIFFAMNGENLTRILRKEYVMIGSDAGARSRVGPLADGVPHPRTFGTFPKVLGEYVREKSIIDLPAAVHKMTGMPCKKLGIKNRGLITEGYCADITVFNPETVSDNSDYHQSKEYPTGIEYVVVNGEIVVEQGEHTGRKPGRALRRGKEYS